MKVNTPAGWLEAIPTKVNTPGGWKDVVSVKVNTPGGWKPVWEAGPLAEEPLWLYGVEQTNKPGRVVDFVLQKGLGPYDPLDEGFMFRCSTISGLDGYVGRNFSKTFPSNVAYTKFDCTVEDMYGDGTANPEYLYRKISFEVRPRA